MAEGFAAEAERLRTGSREHLGNMTDNLTESRRQLVNTSSHDTAFRGGDDRFKSVENRWEEARFYLTRVIDDNILNLDLAAQALEEIARRYEDTDTENAAGLA
ncbi:hypothetical protein EV191_12022 [Tamaricihabitans halophyticus]|uniref:Excreted virulence factor EspC (Type VII ESX diderm) n=1 Tax=Tamaricihabitans halophyticus TaxID=1262583 RepID=A0A4R2Q7I3_9PSEU|nr:hypothetical protein [Tamaricihabitans halophyticus]TCP43868.1 hypothetical protein EV191_12022 [Tamaricihabitans halophyticus]